MSHVQGAKAVANQIKSVAGTAKIMEGTSLMMADGMGSMAKMGDAMAQIAQRSKIPAGVATDAVASAGSSAGKTAITKIFTHPLALSVWASQWAIMHASIANLSFRLLTKPNSKNKFFVWQQDIRMRRFS